MKNRHMSKKIDIFALYLRDYHTSFNGREIAGKCGFSPQAALNEINELVKNNLLLVKSEGRNKKYSLNLQNLQTKLWLSLAETNAANKRMDNLTLKIILNDLLPFSDTLILFGSYAKYLERKDSDLDLIALIGQKEKINKIKERFPMEINIEFVSWKDFKHSLKEKKALALEIKKDHLIFGNVFKVVEAYCE